jgi:hypothetical protein
MYQKLPERRCLATTATFAGGSLVIDFDAANDVAVVDVDAAGNMTINGSDQIDEAGFDTTIAASSVLSISSSGIAGSGQELSLFASMPSLRVVDVLSVDQISFQGSYILDSLDLLDVHTVSQSAGTALTVSAQANILAHGDILLDSQDNDFNYLAATAANISIEDVDSILIGASEASGDAMITAASNIQTNIVAVGAVRLNAGNDISLDGLVGGSATLNAGGTITNSVGAVIDIGNTLVIGDADSVSLGTEPLDTMRSARITADVQNGLNIEQESNIRLMNLSSGDLSVASTGTITNRADVTIDVPGDVELSATNIIIGQTATDVFHAGRLSFESPNIVRISENSSTEIFGSNEARLLVLESDGDITDDPNSVVDIAFSTMFKANNVTVGDAPTDTFHTRTLSFESAGHVDVAQDSRIFLTNFNQSDQLTLASSVSVLDSPTAQVDVLGEVVFEVPYVNVGDNAGDRFDAGAVSFGSSDRVNFSEDSDTTVSGVSDVRQAIIRTAGSLSNEANASFSADSAVLLAANEIGLGVSADDFVDIDRMRFEATGDVTIDQDDSVFLFGNNVAENLKLTASGPIGDSATATIQVNDHAWFTGATIWLGEQSGDEFNTGRLTFNATGNVVVGENSAIMLSGVNSAFHLELTSDGDIEDEALTETIAQKSVTLRAGEVTIGELETDCFDIGEGPSKLLVIAPVSTIVFGCQ